KIILETSSRRHKKYLNNYGVRFMKKNFKSIILFSAFVVLLIQLTTCGGGDSASIVNYGNSILGVGDDSASIDSSVSSMNIGSAGGTVISSDGNVTLTIPAGALDNTTTITIQESATMDSVGAL